MMRRGFTLIELMMALVISSVVITLAYGALRAGIDTGDRATAVREGVLGRAAAREVLADALRHMLPGGRGGPAVFELKDSVGTDGLPHDRVRFVTRGLVPPLGTGAVWLVQVSDRNGQVLLEAETESPAPGTGSHWEGTFPGARGLDVRALADGAAAPWTDLWDDPGVRPRAVALVGVGADGRPDGPPLVIRTDLEGGR